MTANATLTLRRVRTGDFAAEDRLEGAARALEAAGDHEGAAELRCALYDAQDAREREEERGHRC